MKKSEILKKARRLLWDGKGEDIYWYSDKERYICAAIERVSDDDGLNQTLRAWIHSDLLQMSEDYASLEDWLCENHPEFKRTPRRVQQLRRKWINYMISYWESKGE